LEVRSFRAARRSRLAPISIAEYALIGSLIVVVVLGAAVFFGQA
jgi:hypothetical protein